MWKNVKVDRWERQIEIRVPESAKVLESMAAEDKAFDPTEGIRRALKNPSGMAPIKELVNQKSKVAVAFDDPTKFSPNSLTIPLILEELRGAGVKEDNIVLLSGSGTHKRWMPADFIDYTALGYGLLPGMGRPCVPKDIFYNFWPSRFIRHDAANAESLVNMGYSRLGDLVEVNKLLVDCDLVIYTGGIYPMDWGGCGGTGVVIGLGSARSIASHHVSDVFGHQESCHGDPRTHLYRKHKNAIMEKIEEYTGRKVFYIDGVCNGARQWTHFFAGHFNDIQEPAWNAVDQDRLYPVEQADVVVAGLPKWVRYDTTRNPVINFCSAAAILRCWVGKPILREGGVIILVSACDGHINADALPSYPEVLDLYGKMGSVSRLEERYLDEFLFREDYLKKYTYGYAFHPVHPFWLFAETQYVHDHVGKLIIATAENPEAVRKIGGTWTEDVDQAFKLAEKVVGKNPRVLILPTYFTKPPIRFAVK